MIDVDLTETKDPLFEAAYLRIIKLLKEYSTHVEAFLRASPQELACNWKLKALKATNRELANLKTMLRERKGFEAYLRERLEYHFPGRVEKIFQVFLK